MSPWYNIYCNVFLKKRQIKTWQNVQWVFIKHRLNYDRSNTCKIKLPQVHFTFSPAVSAYYFSVCLSIFLHKKKKIVKTSKKNKGRIQDCDALFRIFRANIETLLVMHRSQSLASKSWWKSVFLGYQQFRRNESDNIADIKKPGEEYELSF